MSIKSIYLPTGAKISLAPPSRASQARYAYAATLVLFAAMFGRAAVSDLARVLYAYGLLPRRWAHDVVVRVYYGEATFPLLALVAAMAVGIVLVWRRPCLPGGGSLTGPRRIAATTLFVVVVAAGWWELHRAQTLAMSGDLRLNLLHLSVLVPVMAVVMWALDGPTLPELGLRRKTGRHLAQAHGALTVSLLGLAAAWAVLQFIANEFAPIVVDDPVGYGGMQSGSYLIGWYVVNAVLEETVCTAWLVALLHRAGRPRWEIYALAAAFRISFHLYMGLNGLAAGVFAVTNVYVYERTRRLVPLIVAHAAYDALTGGSYHAVTTVVAWACVVCVLIPPPTLPALRRWWFHGEPRDYSDLDTHPDHIAMAGSLTARNGDGGA